jgi:hypothetical protein
LLSSVKKGNKLEMGTNFVTFRNNSSIIARGITANLQSFNATLIYGDEVEDLNRDALFEVVLPTGARQNTQIILSGVPRGRGFLKELRKTGEFVELPKFDCFDGISFGVLSASYIQTMSKLMTKRQFGRAFLNEEDEDIGFFPIAKISLYDVPLSEPYFIGIDTGSESTIRKTDFAVVVAQVTSQIFKIVEYKIFDRTYSIGEIKSQIMHLIEKYRPVLGVGDAYESSFVRSLNLMAFQYGLTDKNPENLPESEWYITPVWLHGPLKSDKYNILRWKMEDGNFYVAVEDQEKADAEILNQFDNILAERRGNINVFRRENPNIPEDICACCAFCEIAFAKHQESTLKIISTTIELPV